MHICPVCSYDQLPRRAEDFLICPCCGTEFGYTDSRRSHAELRFQWIARGMKWNSPTIHQPAGWNPYTQLSKQPELARAEKAANELDVEFLELGGSGRYIEGSSMSAYISGRWQMITVTGVTASA